MGLTRATPDLNRVYKGGTMETKQLVFVYGTLRSAHSNHHLMSKAENLGAGKTVEKYAMYLTSGYPYVTSSESRYPIIGELYAVDEVTLKELDRMEGHPRFYERREIPVNIAGERYTAWMYFRKPPGILMKTGDFNDVLIMS
jgi:gamma-glutamylcyclotransferase (GGCT)/AIG2-like uncharacterized protein YtfP